MLGSPLGWQCDPHMPRSAADSRGPCAQYEGESRSKPFPVALKGLERKNKAFRLPDGTFWPEVGGEAFWGFLLSMQHASIGRLRAAADTVSAAYQVVEGAGRTGESAVCNTFCSNPDHPFECTDVRGHHCVGHGIVHCRLCRAANTSTAFAMGGYRQGLQTGPEPPPPLLMVWRHWCAGAWQRCRATTQGRKTPTSPCSRRPLLGEWSCPAQSM